MFTDGVSTLLLEWPRRGRSWQRTPVISGGEEKIRNMLLIAIYRAASRGISSRWARSTPPLPTLATLFRLGGTMLLVVGSWLFLQDDIFQPQAKPSTRASIAALDPTVATMTQCFRVQAVMGESLVASVIVGTITSRLVE